MNKVVKGSFELMKQMNVSAVLKIIRDNGSLSRADVAKITGLTPASVTNITKILIEDGYLVECKIGESSGGRPPIILELNPNARYVIGVGIGVGVIDVVITNLSAHIILKKSIEISEERYDYDFVFKKLVNLINEVIKESYELDSIDEEELFDEYMTLSDELAMELEEYMPEDIIINARAYKWDNSDNTIKLVLAMAHLELGELKLSDITRRLLTQVD